MRAPEIPDDEEARLASLKRLNLLDTPAEERFDRITRLARKSLNTSIALVSLVDHDRQWFKSSQGLAAAQSDRSISFCGHAILDDATFVVPDASMDERFCDNPLVIGEPSIRFYAGHPIRTPDGHRIGTLCVIDRSPREPTWEDLRALEDLSALVEVELRSESLSESERQLREQLAEAERRASIDALTQLWNRDTVLRLLREEFERAARLGNDLAVLFIDVDHFKSINDTFGHPAGDQVLKATAARLRAAIRGYDSIGRYGGEEFLAILPGCNLDRAAAVAQRMCQHLHAGAIHVGDAAIHVTASIGICSRSLNHAISLNQMLEAADRALYMAKSSGRDCVKACEESTAMPSQR